MQIIFAAPFLFLAAILFTFLSAFTKLRPYAVAIPAGIIAFAPGGIVGLLVIVLPSNVFFTHVVNTHPASNWLTYAVPTGAFGLSGLTAAIIAALVMRWILRIAPGWAIRAVVFCGAFCSYCVLTAAVVIVARVALSTANTSSWLLLLITITVSLSGTLLGALLISSNPETYRIQKNNRSMKTLV